MRIEKLANEIRPGDQIWFGGQRRPSAVLEVAIQEGAEKLVVIKGENALWYLPYESGVVNVYEPDAPVTEDELVLEDPDGNPA